MRERARFDPAQERPGPHEATAVGLRVLVVEDQPEAARTMALLLERSGYAAEVAGTGGEAVAAAEARPPDVVLLDLGLPDFDGYEVARRIRALPGAKRPLLVAVTGKTQEHDRLRSCEAGIDLHLVKPVDVQFLAGLLGRFGTVALGL